MSRLSPHVQALRAEGAELIKLGREDHSASKDAATTEERAVNLTSALIVTRMGQAKLKAADKLQEWENNLMEGTHG